MKEVKDKNGTVVAVLFTEEDIDFTLDSKTLAVIGYGSQGRAQSLCFRDSGINVILGLRKNGNSWKKAIEDGWKEGENLFTISEAAKKADIIHMLIPDTVQAGVYEKEIKHNLKEGDVLSFSHGYNIRFKLIVPPKTIDVVMVAPKGPGTILREEYKKGFGVPALIAIEQDFSSNAKNIALAMAKAIGATKPGVLETTFKDETEIDLFGEQVDLCGGVTELVKKAYETLIEDGRNPVLAYWEVHHELFGLIAPLSYQFGNTGMLRRVSITARDGAIQSGPRVITEDVKTNMKKVLEDIKKGIYAEGWNKRYKEKAQAAVDEPIAELEKHPLEFIGKQVRKVMWPGKVVE
jgi:ketol-acid reductoisomerase